MSTENDPAIPAPRNTSIFMDPSDESKHKEYSFLPSVVIPLTFPIQIGGAKVDKLTMRRPKVKDQKAAMARKDDDNALLYLLCGISPDEFEELDVADVKLMGEWLTVFVSAKRTS